MEPEALSLMTNSTLEGVTARYGRNVFWVENLLIVFLHTVYSLCNSTQHV